jgi:hypothetical protein
MDGDGDGTLTFTTATPAQVDFIIPAAGFTDFMLSIDLAGLPSVEPENYLRAFLDGDDDSFYETPIFNFAGAGNSPYVDSISGQSLSGNFATFVFPLPAPTASDGALRLRLEVFNDTNTLTEASGVDNILVTGVPEPGVGLLAGFGCLAFLSRRRQRPVL